MRFVNYYRKCFGDRIRSRPPKEGASKPVNGILRFFMDYNYIITSGWWCQEDDSVVDRQFKRGHSFIRSAEFHKVWFKAVDKFTNCKKIYIIDSNSPIKPLINEEHEILVSLDSNAGHPSMHTGKISGVSRAHLLGMAFAMANEIDYWVYVEQDALIYGEGIIEKCIEKMKKPYMFGSGRGTPQPAQHSLMIIKKEAIPKFIKNFNQIKAKDSEISPEIKFAIATSFFLRLIPEFFYIKMNCEGRVYSYIRRFVWKLFDLFQGFDDIPFGYGRVRPIDYSQSHFYFQHGEGDELSSFMRNMLGYKNVGDYFP